MEKKKKFQSMTMQEKAEHIWEYYKLVLLGIVLAVAFIIYVIVKIVSPDPEEILHATLVNALSYGREEEDTFERYLREHGYNQKEVTIGVNSGLYLDTEGMSQGSAASYQALMAMVMVGEIDILTGNQDVLNLLGPDGGLTILDEILDEELLEKYKDRLYTAKDPETGSVYICGIKLPADNSLIADGYYLEDDVWVAIPYTAAHKELAGEVLLYLLGE